MAYMIFCQDIEDAAALRQLHLQAHLDYIAGIIDQVSVAGPLAGTAGGDYDGSCFIYASDELEVVLRLFFNDPYFVAGIYQQYTIKQFNPVAGVWLGGTTW